MGGGFSRLLSRRHYQRRRQADRDGRGGQRGDEAKVRHLRYFGKFIYWAIIPKYNKRLAGLQDRP